ncbi:MAG TPA: cob(I)yrinic acid a,c-diamide adenosyltransferase [Firmicutes bacterium]|nr:cob(I)yrinic acid a,c-diamide adenosyltransferase [Bacillota bacterium]
MTPDSNRGYVQVYTGDGKGKTTAAIGLAIRALGAGKRVLFVQFMKQPTYSEHEMLSNFSPNLKLVTLGKPYFIARSDQVSPETATAMGDKIVLYEPGQPPADYVALIRTGLSLAQAAFRSRDYDVIVLDELCVALHLGLITWQEVRTILEERPQTVEVVITGRGAPEELIDCADLVTEMREVKHYYHQGVPARVGIEN